MTKKAMVRILKENYNLYVRNELTEKELRDLEKEVGFELTVRQPKNTDIGFIIERK